METKQAVSLVAALAVAQSKMKNPKMDSVNPHFRNRYASLAAVLAVVTPPLNEQGIFITQELRTEDGLLSCEVVARKDAEEIRFGAMRLPVGKPDVQGYGSATTYARRYTLQSTFGLVGEEDDDGEAASRPQPQQQPAKPLFKKNPPKAEANRAMELITKAEAAGLKESDIKAFLEAKQAWPAGCERVADLKPSIIERLLDKDVFTTLINFANNAEVQS